MNNPKNQQVNRMRISKSPSPDKLYSKSKQKPNNLNNNNNKYSVLDEMEKMKQRREDRKRRMEEEKRNKIELLNNPDYIPKLDTDYEYMIAQKKKIIESHPPSEHTTSENSKIFVCVRKRPIFQKEILNGEIDCITALNPKVCVYDCKMKIDGITKYIDTNEFYFDNAFNEFEDTKLLYDCTIKPNINLLLQKGVVTCFAYGQTGSGKTYTMKGIQDLAIDSLFEAFEEVNKDGRYQFFVSFFEIYSGRLYDLLNNRNKVMALEDKNQKVQIFGLTLKSVESSQEMKDVVDYANTMRTTHNTVTNETSSRSHSICNFIIKDKKSKKDDEEFAKLTLVDLAGSERATETQSNDKSRLAEGAEINKSLLALKECIRALDARKTTGNSDQHVPFRTSKLTLVLRDSFISKSNISKIIMISCISPGYSSSNHTINTLRYADRLKEKTLQMNKNKGNGHGSNSHNNYENSNYVNNANLNLNNNYIVKDSHQKNSSSNNIKGCGSKESNAKNSNNNNLNNIMIQNNKEQKKKAVAINLNPFDKSNDDINSSDNLCKNQTGEFFNDIKDYDDSSKNKKMINNFFEEDDEIEDDLQKLSLGPTPISKPTIQSHKPKYAINKRKLNKKQSTNNAEQQEDQNKVNNNTNNTDSNINNITPVNNSNITNSNTSANTNININNIRPIQNKSKTTRVNNDQENKNDLNEIDYLKSNIDDTGNEDSSKKFENEVNYINEDKQEIIPYMIEEQDNLVSTHMAYLKEDAKMLTEEGVMISTFKGVTRDGKLPETYTMDEYSVKLESIIEQKLKYYKLLKNKIKNFKEIAGKNVNS